MLTIFDPRQLGHAPAQELHNGGWTPHADVPGRAEAIARAVGPARAPLDHGRDPILAVHDAGYVAFLERAHAAWTEAGRAGDAIGYAWPVVARRHVEPVRIDALLGRYSFDAVTPIAAGTWTAAYWGAQTALTGLGTLLAGEAGAAFALCRPPGHHAGADYLGGYSYLNNAAIAAEAATRAGRRVAILDVDYHHGNGTQDIFWDRGDIFFASLHADPATDYPFFWGREDEAGGGAGAGATLNIVLPHGTAIGAYRAALDRALAAIRGFAPDLLIVSFGADTFAGDPLCRFAIETRDYPAMAAPIAALGLPTLIVMEGGYAVDALGANVAGFLGGWG